MPTQQKHPTSRVPRQRVLPVYLSIEEAAEVMSLSTKTIRRRISDGSIPAYRCGRRDIRIRLDELGRPSGSCPLLGTDGPLVDT